MFSPIFILKMPIEYNFAIFSIINKFYQILYIILHWKYYLLGCQSGLVCKLRLSNLSSWFGGSRMLASELTRQPVRPIFLWVKNFKSLSYFGPLWHFSYCSHTSTLFDTLVICNSTSKKNPMWSSRKSGWCWDSIFKADQESHILIPS